MIRNQTLEVLRKKCDDWLVGDSSPYTEYVDGVKLYEAEEFHDLQKDEKIKEYINDQYNIGLNMKLSSLLEKQNLIKAITEQKNRYCVEFKLSAWYVQYIGTLNIDGSFRNGCLFYSLTNNHYMQICYDGKYSSIPNTRDTYRLRGYIKDNDVNRHPSNIYHDEHDIQVYPNKQSNLCSPKNISQSNKGTPTAKKLSLHFDNLNTIKTARIQQYPTCSKTEARKHNFFLDSDKKRPLGRTEKITNFFFNPAKEKHTSFRRTEKITPNLFLNPAKEKHTSFRRTEKITPNLFLDQANKAKVNGVFNKLLQKNPNLIHLTKEQVANVFTSEKTELSLLELRFRGEFRKECKEQGLQTSDEKSPRSNNFFSLFKGNTEAEQKQNMNAYFEERFEKRDKARDEVYKERMREIEVRLGTSAKSSP